MMRIVQLVRDLSAPAPDKSDLKYEAAMKLVDEVTDLVRKNAASANPFRPVLVEMLVGSEPPDPALIADAFEIIQEAQIFKGPPNGRG